MNYKKKFFHVEHISTEKLSKKFKVLDNKVSLPIFNKGLGQFSVNGRSRLPNPAESIMALIII